MEKVKEARLSMKGQITVPKAVRERLGVGEGDTVAFYFENNEVKLTSTSNLNVSPKDKRKQGTVKGEKQNG